MRRPALALVLALSGCTHDDEPAPVEPEVPDVAYCDAVREWQADWSSFEGEVLVLLNERRAEGAACSNDDVFDPAPPLTMNPALRCAARYHARDMGVQDYFSNLDPDKLSFIDRAMMAGYEGTALEQNIGAGQSDPEQLVTAVMGSTKLCAHVMDPDTDEVGIGFLEFDGASFPTYWAMVFGES